MRGRSHVVVVVASLALTGCAAALQYTVTADMFTQPSRVSQGAIFDVGGPSPAFTPPSGPSSEAPTIPGEPAEMIVDQPFTGRGNIVSNQVQKRLSTWMNATK